MDAEYYYSGGVRLSAGYGFTEEILWNYLDDPAGIPHPSHGYWMPLVSILAAVGMKLTGALNFTGARLVYFTVFAAVPPLTAALSFSLTGKKNAAIMAGLLAVVPGFYLPYLATTDSFGLYMLFGAFFLLLTRASWLGTRRTYPPLASLLLGVLAGFMHLTRADGLLWLLIGLFVVFFQGRELFHFRRLFVLMGLCVFGYLVVMGPWMVRNWEQFGAVFSPGGGRTLWLRAYDELFIYPAHTLTFERWWASGLGQILRDRLSAAGLNLQTALAVQGAIFLAPLVLIGLWRLRADRRVQIAVLAWSLTFIAMTIPFPYAGARGGFFHSGAALQPMWWAVAPLGLTEIINWIGQKRHWNLNQAQRVFQFGILGLAFLFTIIVFYSRVIGPDINRFTWSSGSSHYLELEAMLHDLGAQNSDTVMVNNSPGYYAANDRGAVSIPFGDLQVALTVAERYDVRYLLLEIDQIHGVDNLYQTPGDRPGIAYLGSFKDTRIYQFLHP
jgi:hypothetical protein